MRGDNRVAKCVDLQQKAVAVDVAILAAPFDTLLIGAKLAEGILAPGHHVITHERWIGPRISPS